ncbi:MAG: IMP cyclohydrolase [Candidatus Nanoarchaeia archaeon]|nr:IMP cyclohydrolase [Candidatus Nanoarchaeia archaeon]
MKKKSQGYLGFKMKDDFSALERMEYSGRGITIGATPKNDIFVVYTLTGRGDSSKARKLKEGSTTHIVSTEVTNEEQIKKGNQALLIYPAIMPINNSLTVSNGAQTDLLYTQVKNNPTLRGAWKFIELAFKKQCWRYDSKTDTIMDITTYEPDSSTTPRIAAVVDGADNKNLTGALWIARNNKGEREVGEYMFLIKPGLGHLITTYKGDNESPLLLPFVGNTLEVTVRSTNATDLVDNAYKSIENHFGVAAAAVVMDREGKLDIAIINACDLNKNEQQD